MTRPRTIDTHLVKKAQQIVKHTKDADELRQALSVLLPAKLNASLEQTAEVLGVGRATVPRFQARLRQRTFPGMPTLKPWGGRRRSLLSAAEEQEFLRPWAEQASTGGVLVLSPIRAALSQRMGQPVAASVVYRLLARHGWRKVAPDTRHPKSDPKVQEDWKKNSRKRWLPG